MSPSLGEGYSNSWNLPGYRSIHHALKHRSRPQPYDIIPWTLVKMPFSVHALGSNSSGQLGIGHQDDTSEAQLCKFPAGICQQPNERIQKIVAGGNHTVVLTKAGRLLTSGNAAAFGVSSNGVEAHRTSFQAINLDSIPETGTAETTTDVAASWEATFVVIDRRKLYVCGKGSKGELGLGKSTIETQDFVLVKDFDDGTDSESYVTTMAAAVNHVILITSDGKAYGWGSSRKGQLGDEHKAAKVIWQPVEINIPFQVKTAVVGRDFSFILGVDGQQLFLGEHKHFPSDSSLFPSSSALEISSGWSTIYARGDDELHVAGRNSAGQPSTSDLPDLRYFAAGSEHCIACTPAGEVIAWGWNEHGNCGHLSETRSSAYSTIPVALAKGERVGGVAAGCATSFIIIESTTMASE